METTGQTFYFSQPGPINTERTLEIVLNRAAALRIGTILVASTSGSTAVKAATLLKDFTVVAVSHSTGFQRPYHQEFKAENAEILKEKGIRILTTTHAFGGIGRSVRKKFGTYETDEIIAFTLRTFGQGVKVAAEITLMAADAGLVPEGKPVIALAGSGSGADTAVVLLPTNAQTFFDLKFLEILCMPSPEHPAFF